MKKVYVVSLDEEFEKAQLEKGRGPDKRLRKRRKSKSLATGDVRSRDPGKDYGDIDERPARGFGKPFKFKWEK